MRKNQRRFEGPGARSKRRTCKLCGRTLSMYNDTGACHSHRCAPDCNGEWEPSDRANERIRIMEASDVPLSQQETLICSPGPFGMILKVVLLWVLLAVPAWASSAQPETFSSFQFASGCFEAVEYINIAHHWRCRALVQSCGGDTVFEWYSPEMSDHEIRTWFLQARRIYYIKTHQHLRRPK